MRYIVFLINVNFKLQLFQSWLRLHLSLVPFRLMVPCILWIHLDLIVSQAPSFSYNDIKNYVFCQGFGIKSPTWQCWQRVIPEIATIALDLHKSTFIRNSKVLLYVYMVRILKWMGFSSSKRRKACPSIHFSSLLFSFFFCFFPWNSLFLAPTW